MQVRVYNVFRQDSSFGFPTTPTFKRAIKTTETFMHTFASLQLAVCFIEQQPRQENVSYVAKMEILDGVPEVVVNEE